MLETGDIMRYDLFSAAFINVGGSGRPVAALMVFRSPSGQLQRGHESGARLRETTGARAIRQRKAWDRKYLTADETDSLAETTLLTLRPHRLQYPAPPDALAFPLPTFVKPRPALNLCDLSV